MDTVIGKVNTGAVFSNDCEIINFGLFVYLGAKILPRTLGFLQARSIYLTIPIMSCSESTQLLIAPAIIVVIIVFNDRELLSTLFHEYVPTNNLSKLQFPCNETV